MMTWQIVPHCLSGGRLLFAVQRFQSEPLEDELSSKMAPSWPRAKCWQAYDDRRFTCQTEVQVPLYKHQRLWYSEGANFAGLSAGPRHSTHLDILPSKRR